MTGVVAVTGASGFVGRRLCARLITMGFRVRGLGRHGGQGPWDQWAGCDIDEAVPARLLDGVHTVFHVAGRAHMGMPRPEDAHLFFRTNRDGTVNLMEAAVQAGVRQVVFFSTVKAAGDPGSQCVDENWGAPPDDAYGRSKLEAEHLVFTMGRAGGMHVCCLRPALVYGPGVKGNLWRMMQAIDRNRFPPIPEYGNKRSLIHVDDLVAAAVLAMERPEADGRTYIVAEPEPYSSRQIYEILALALKGSIPRWSAPDWLLRAGARVGDLLDRWGMPAGFDTPAYQRLSSSACYLPDRIARELGFGVIRTLGDAADDMVEQFRP